MVRKSTEEINLLDILAGIFLALRKNLILTILLPLAGALAGIAFTYFSKDIYRSGLLIETSLLSENESRFLLDELDKSSALPGLTAEQSNLVAGLSFETLNTPPGVVIEKNPLSEKTIYLRVTASVFSHDVFPALQESVFNYLDQSQAVVRHRKERLKYYGELISRIDMEIAAMDELKKQVGTKGDAIYLNPSELYTRTIELYKEKKQYEIKSEEVKAIQLVKGFDSLALKQGRSKLTWGLAGFAAGIVLLCFVLFAKFFTAYFSVYQQRV